MAAWVAPSVAVLAVLLVEAPPALLVALLVALLAAMLVVPWAALLAGLLAALLAAEWLDAVVVLAAAFPWASSPDGVLHALEAWRQFDMGAELPLAEVVELPEVAAASARLPHSLPNH